MRREDLFAQLRAQSVVPVALSSLGDEGSRSQLWDFDGSFDEFVQVAKELEVRAIFVVTFAFDENDFMYDPSDDEEDEIIDEDGEPIDLTQLRPALARFRKHVGELVGYELVVSVGNDILVRFSNFGEEWYSQFSDLKDDAIAQRRAAGGGAREAEEKAAQARQAAVHERLDSLATDSEFMRLPTKAAMLAFMRERVPEVDDELDPRQRTSKVAELYARAHLARARSRKK